MDLDVQSRYLLKAVNTLNGEVVVISKDFKVLAANDTVIRKRGNNLMGRACHEVFFDLPSPCDNCSAKKVVAYSNTPMSFGLWTEGLEIKQFSCHPIRDGENIEALLLTDLDITKHKWLEDELHRTNAFFRNMIGSALDGVIAADRTGKILIFNDAASEITGFSVEEGLQHDIRNLYPEGGALEVMRMLRSNDYGGKGKLKSFQFEILRKNGEPVPISLNAAIVYEGDKEVASIGFFHDLREELKMKKKKLEKTPASACPG